MRHFLETYRPGVGLGMASAVLAVIAMLLAFLPVLGIPISLLGLGFGLVGFVAALFHGGAMMRWSLAGLAGCCLALAINLAIYYAPEGYLPGRKAPQLWQPVPDRPYVPPPALPLDG
jgi:hypothetical protein